MKFVSKPEEVEAIQLTTENLNEVRKWLEAAPKTPFTLKRRGNTLDLTVQTPNGLVQVPPGHYLIKLIGEAEVVNETLFKQYFSQLANQVVRKPVPKRLDAWLPTVLGNNIQTLNVTINNFGVRRR